GLRKSLFARAVRPDSPPRPIVSTAEEGTMTMKPYFVDRLVQHVHRPQMAATSLSGVVENLNFRVLLVKIQSNRWHRCPISVDTHTGQTLPARAKRDCSD